MKDDKKKIEKKLKKVEKYYKETYPKEEAKDTQDLSEYLIDEKEHSVAINVERAEIDVRSMMEREQMNREMKEDNRKSIEEILKPSYVTNNTVIGDGNIVGNNNSMKQVKKNDLLMKILGYLKFW